MSDYRLVAIDADGTLCGDEDRISDRVRTALRACVAAGLELVLATGRGPRMVRHLVEQLGVPVGLVMGNGALVCPAIDQPPIAERMLPPALA
ncbi:MAG: HAD hydrolase family protein, partial [Armatimonadetes bacterium]|nr:HAD hydrolase family protein [Armatimonadota bacterium]